MNAIPLLLVFFVVAYFLLIRPQKQRVRVQRDLHASIVVGDHVVTTAGIVGDVVGLNDERMQLEIADGVVIEILRPYVNRRIEVSAPFWGTTSEEEEEDEEVDGEEGQEEYGEGEYEEVEESAEDVTEAETDSEAEVDSEAEAAEVESDDGVAANGTAGSDGSIEEGAVPAPGQDPH
jgi:preprotein translocase subunit YajC